MIKQETVNGGQLSLFGFFDVFGRISTHTWHGFFNIDNDLHNEFTFYVNDQVITTPQEIDFKRYKLLPVEGQVQTNDKLLPNIRVDFISTNNILGEHNNVLVDSVFTNAAGKYKAYIPPGVYNIIVYAGNKTITQNNIKVVDGIKYERKLLINGTIKRRYDDIIEFFDTDYVLISGNLIDINNRSFKDAEIIIIDPETNEVNTYLKTDDKGKYRFALKYGKYIVKLRAPGIPVKTVTINLNGIYGFINQLQANINFSRNNLLML